MCRNSIKKNSKRSSKLFYRKSSRVPLEIYWETSSRIQPVPLLRFLQAIFKRFLQDSLQNFLKHLLLEIICRVPPNMYQYFFWALKGYLQGFFRYSPRYYSRHFSRNCFTDNFKKFLIHFCTKIPPQNFNFFNNYS